MRRAGGLRWVVQNRSMTISNRKITNTQGESLLVENYARGRTLFEQMRSAVQRHNGGLTEEQTQNIAAAGLAEYRRRETQVREPQDIAVYGDRLFTSYFPRGQGREPMFHANVRLEDVANVPARESVQQVEGLARQQTTGAQERERGQEQQGLDVGRGR